MQTAPTPHSAPYDAERLLRGGHLLNHLRWQPSFGELERTVMELSVEDLRDLAVRSVALYQQEAKSPDDYAGWWRQQGGADAR